LLPAQNIERIVGKILFALLTAAIAWILFKGFTKNTAKDDAKKVVSRGNTSSNPSTNSRGDGGSGDGDGDSDTQALERMVKCSVCGVHMPESESISSQGETSCREPSHCAHRRQA
jgi:hypothetical protein